MKPFKNFVAEASKTRNPTRDFLRKNPVPDSQMAKPVKKQDAKKSFENMMGGNELKKLKIKEQKSTPGDEKDEREYGYEGDMVISQLKTIVRHSEMLLSMLKPEDDLPEWVQSKITLATDYIQTSHDYLMSEDEK